MASLRHFFNSLAAAALFFMASASLHAAEKAPVQRTLSIIKPDAVAGNHIGEIIARFEKNGLRIAAIKMVSLTPDQAGQFYAVHKDRPFYKDLTKFMGSSPVVVMVLEGPNAVVKNREIMGATDPKKAAAGTIRADFAQSVEKNAVHGSDAEDTAKAEITFFFKPEEIFSPASPSPSVK